MIKYNNTEYHCSMELTLDVIGGKWKPLILWYLAKNTMRFSELRRKLSQVTQKMLTQQLRGLEESGLVNRFVYTQVPPKVEYSLTSTGKSLIPILENLREWGLKYSHISEPSDKIEL